MEQTENNDLKLEQRLQNYCYSRNVFKELWLVLLGSIVVLGCFLKFGVRSVQGVEIWRPCPGHWECEPAGIPCYYYCDSGGSGVIYDPHDVRGPRYRFVFYPTAESVPWPLGQGENSFTGWVEKFASGVCNKPSIGMEGIKIKTFGTEDPPGSDALPRLVETDYSPEEPNNYPVCSQSYPYAEVRSMFYDYYPSFFPTFHPQLTQIIAPASSELRQFGFKILKGVDINGNEVNTRPVYGDLYDWDDKTITSWGAFTKTYPGYRSKNGESKLVINDVTRPLYAWVFGSASVYYNHEKGHCSFPVATCNTGYVKMRATNEIDAECKTATGPLGDTPPAEVYTCKRKETARLFSDNWQPEGGSASINLKDLNVWSRQEQWYKIYQNFTFTVDRTGSYYFVSCPNTSYTGKEVDLCTATMTINGGGIVNGNGWNDIAYQAGTTYQARFECTGGDCYYGLGVAPKSSLGNISTDTDYLIYVPFIYRNPPTQKIYGTIFDASSLDLNACSVKSPGVAGATVSWGSYADETDVNGEYSIEGIVSGAADLSVQMPVGGGYGVSPQYSCNGSLGSLTVGVGVSVQRDFGYIKTFSGWFQAVGGDVYAKNGISEIIPGGNYLIDGDPITSMSGLARYKTGLIYLGIDGEVSAERYKVMSGPPGGRAIYDYGYYLAKTSGYTRNDWVSGLPDYLDSDGNGFEIFKKEDDAVINFNFDFSGNKKIIMLIDGNVRVQNNIVVPAGSFLAIIASGTVTFDADVTRADGFFVADSIVVSSTGDIATEEQFVGQGSFVAYEAMVLSRDRGETNNTESSEKFIYRPDLVIAAPVALMTRDTLWREVVPGSLE